MTSPAPAADGLDRARLPRHVAWTAGGSARWAAQRGAGPEAVASASAAALRALVEGALDLGVRWLTVEVDATDDAHLIAGRLDGWFATRGVALRHLGREGVTAAGPVAGSEDGGSGGEPSLVCTLAAGYSGHAEIAHAIHRLAEEGVPPSAVDEAAIARHLYLADAPDPDLVVRTGGDRRVPDLLLWSVAYSELVVLADPWPEVGRGHLELAVAEYQRRDRRYGGLVTSGPPR